MSEVSPISTPSLSKLQKIQSPFAGARHHEEAATSDTSSDAAELKRLGYKSEFVREFGNLSTFSFAFSIMGMTASIATTLNTPLLYAGGPSSVIFCWLMGSIFNMSLGASIAELVSAYPTSGGLYSASAYLTPKKYRAMVGWIVGWLNLLGQVAGVASTEYGLAYMIWAAVSLGDETFVPTTGMQFGLFCGLLVIHGIINSLRTKELAYLTKFFVFINVGSALIIIIVLLAMTPRADMNANAAGFTTITNATGYSSDGLAFLLGLLAVQWTMTDYDAAAHISEEVHRASIAAPVAIATAVLGTGVIGFLLNLVLMLCAPPLADLPGPSGQSFLAILDTRIGRSGALVLWSFTCLVAFFTVTTALQAVSRTFFAFSRDHGLPDRGVFGKMFKQTAVPINAVWLVVVLSALMGVLSFASSIAVNAIFSMCAVALDLSYIIPVICRRVFANHPDVNFVPGPFSMGKWGYAVNVIMVLWTLFEVVILSFPTIQDWDATTLNYSWVITFGVIILSLVWYYAGANKHYKGPTSNLGAGASHDEDLVEAERHSDEKL